VKRLRSRFHDLALAAAIGLAFAFLAFAITGAHERSVWLGGPVGPRGSAPCSWIGADFDPLTGIPHGEVVACTNAATHKPIPPDLAGRWAIPLPLGFLVGSGAALMLGAAIGALRRRDHRAMVPPPRFGLRIRSAIWFALAVFFWAWIFLPATGGSPPELSMQWEEQLELAVWFVAAFGSLAAGVISLGLCVAPIVPSPATADTA
jgi:hypothetical protein